MYVLLYKVLLFMFVYSLLFVCFFYQVNTKAAGKAAIHCASVAGNMTVIKCLLEFHADVEIEVNFL